ncbi:MAG TPA: YceI family protein, partial [Actinomycetota bacterium]|nr:YceI family protein [Actinomycetota bacterium]
MSKSSNGAAVIKWVLVGVVGLGLLGVLGSYVYINFIREEAPERLDTTPEVVGSVDPNVTLEGTWAVAEGSQVGYRVQEILFGQEAEAVGRTSDITGTFTINGNSLTEGSFEADMTTVTSDQERRDGQFRGRIMEVDRYPTATFELTEPLDLSGIDPQQTEATATATGDLTVHGVTNEVTFEISGVRSGSIIQITGS